MDRDDIDVIVEARKILWGKDEKLSTQEDFSRLWTAINAEIREKLLAGRASQLIGVGTFSVSQWRHGHRLVQSSPVFALSGRLVHAFGVRECRKWGPEAAPRLLTAASLSGVSAQGLRGAAAFLGALQCALRSCVAAGYASLVFPGLGTLLVARGVARMTFQKDFLDEFHRRQRQHLRRPRHLLPPPPPPPQPASQATTSRQPPPPLQQPAKRVLHYEAPPVSSHCAKQISTPQMRPSLVGQRLSKGESNPQGCERRRSGPLSQQQRQPRTHADTGGTPAARASCNLTSCSRHSRHASKPEPRSLPELPDLKERRKEMEIAEFYRRQELEKVDREGVLRLYQLECEMGLERLLRQRATAQRQMGAAGNCRYPQAQGDTLSTSSGHVNKAVEGVSAKKGVAHKSVGFLTGRMSPC